MFWPQTKGKGSAGGKTGGKQAKYRKRAAINFNPALLSRDRSSDWFKQRKLRALIQGMALNRKPSSPPPQAQDLPSPTMPKKPRPGV